MTIFISFLLCFEISQGCWLNHPNFQLLLLSFSYAYVYPYGGDDAFSSSFISSLMALQANPISCKNALKTVFCNFHPFL